MECRFGGRFALCLKLREGLADLHLELNVVLHKAIDCGFERAVFGFRNVQHKMQDRVASL